MPGALGGENGSYRGLLPGSEERLRGDAPQESSWASSLGQLLHDRAGYLAGPPVGHVLHVVLAEVEPDYFARLPLDPQLRSTVGLGLFYSLVRAPSPGALDKSEKLSEQPGLTLGLLSEPPTGSAGSASFCMGGWRAARKCGGGGPPGP